MRIDIKQKNIKIMHIVSSLGAGDMEMRLVKMLKLFDKRHFINYVCCLEEAGELIDDLEKAGIKVFFIAKSERFDFFKIFKLSDILREQKIDIAHTYSGVYRDGAIAAKLAGVPIILHTDYGRIRPDVWLTRLYHRLLTNLFRQKVIAISTDIRNYLINEVKISPHKVIVIPNEAYAQLYKSYFSTEGNKIAVMHLASNPEWAGAEVHLATLVNSLKDDKRIDVSVCVFHDGKLVDSLQERGIKVNVIPLKWIFDISVIFKLARIMRDEKTEILHTHGYKANVIGALAALLAGHTVCIRTEHGLTEPFRGFDRLKMSFYICLDYLTAKLLTKKIIAVSRDIQQKSMTKYPKDKVKTIHNGIDIASNEVSGGEKLKKILGIKADGLIVGTVGRLVPVKGHEYFINAAKLILEKRQDVHFLIVGDGPLKAYLESKVLESGLGGHITFTGFRNDVKDIIGLIDIIVFPSLSEGIPYALLEAMAARKAVIATRTGGLTEVILDGQNGWLIEIANEKELAEKCLYLLENQDVIKNIGENAEKTVKENFSAEAMKEETVKVYEESLAV